MMAFCAMAQDLYVGSFYVTPSTEESQWGDGGDKWATRRTPIYNMFKFEQPDVLGLQGLTSSQFLQMKVGMAYAAAEDILYNKSLELDSCGVVDGMPEGCSCTWASLRKEGRAFFVFNMSCTPDSALASAMRIRTVVGTINNKTLPAFLVGYLGVDETKTPYTRLTSKFNDCYTKASVRSAEYGTVNNFDLEANHGTARLDFVMASKNITKVRAYGQLQYGYFTKESDGTYKRRLPSTHFPVMAKVTLPQ